MGFLNASLFGAGAGNGDASLAGLLPMLAQQGGFDPRSPGIAPPPPGSSGPQFGGMLGAFAQNPQFQQQLQALMQDQGPGRGPVSFTPPPMQMSTSVPGPGARPAGNRLLDRLHSRMTGLF